MPGIVVVGTQWGDEGKGKIVDYLAQNADAVVRYQGGNNAGHTVVVGKETFKLHLIPSGVLYPNVKNFVGAGVVVNPEVILGEIEKLQQKGVKPNLTISEKAHVILPLHITQDKAADTAQGKYSAGSTKRGIAPAYSDKTARHGIRMVDLLDKQVLKEKLVYLYQIKENTIKHVYGQKMEITHPKLVSLCFEHAKKLEPYVGDASLQINQMLDEGKTVVFEGAQGTMLDVDHGLYPYGTSSNPIAGGACIGAGVGPTRISKVVGVVKAYTSRVGKGPVPTELTDELGNQIRKKGNEFGTTTGRPRRIGWLDLVTLRYAIRVSGITELAMTKLDVLSDLDKIYICTHYTHNNKKIQDQPARLSVYKESKPIYQEFQGFGDIACGKKYSDLPQNARDYVEFVENSANTQIKIVSVGPGRFQTIVRD